MHPHETRLQRTLYRWCGAAVLAGVVFGIVRTLRVEGPEGLFSLGKLAVTSLLLLGKFVVFVGLHDESRSSIWELAVMVWLIDGLLAFALASGLENLERAAFVGPWLRRSRARAQEVLASYPGLERMAFFGVALYVMLPLACTGAVTGSFAARVVGLSRVTGVLAILLGSAGTSLAFVLLAHFLGERAEDLARSPLLSASFLVALIVMGRFAWKRFSVRLR